MDKFEEFSENNRFLESKFVLGAHLLHARTFQKRSWDRAIFLPKRPKKRAHLQVFFRTFKKCPQKARNRPKTIAQHALFTLFQRHFRTKMGITLDFGPPGPRFFSVQLPAMRPPNETRRFPDIIPEEPVGPCCQGTWGQLHLNSVRSTRALNISTPTIPANIPDSPFARVLQHLRKVYH